MTAHPAVAPEITLPPQYVAAEQLMRQFDSALRVRRSVQHPGFYVLERRTSRTKPMHIETQYDELGNEKPSDMKVATRDGYLFISHVHPHFLDEPNRILEQLRAHGNDLQAPGNNAARAFDQMVRDREEAKARRAAFQLDEWDAYFRESFDILDRVGDQHSHAERMRLNNAGGEERFNVTDHRRIKPEDVGITLNTPSAGETPAKELSDEHTPGTTARREDGQLQHQAAG